MRTSYAWCCVSINSIVHRVNCSSSSSLLLFFPFLSAVIKMPGRNKLNIRQIEAMKKEQDAFWVSYHSYLRAHEDVLGEFCRRHGRRVKAYPKLPSYAPTRWVLRNRTIYDISVEECRSCAQEQDVRQYSNPTKEEGLMDLYDYGNYRYQVYYSAPCCNEH
uniref:U2 protein n=1 Tax=Milk vetch chlorotic dwarf virus TaxID=2683340 RepID=A0A650FZ15_9VIRU|nr:U2 protein [Milk vetch chlorotic dwarf virus]